MDGGAFEKEREGGREGERERGREGGRERGREGGRERDIFLQKQNPLLDSEPQGIILVP